MNNIERDKFLTEAMRECWHDWRKSDVCNVCNDFFQRKQPCFNLSFSTWEGFGKLWEWVQKQEWFCDFYWYYLITDDGRDEHLVHIAKINPDCFALAVYEYLKENEHKT